MLAKVINLISTDIVASNATHSIVMCNAIVAPTTLTNVHHPIRAASFFRRIKDPRVLVNTFTVPTPLNVEPLTNGKHPFKLFQPLLQPFQGQTLKQNLLQHVILGHEPQGIHHELVIGSPRRKYKFLERVM